jgi:hypothetical protein
MPISSESYYIIREMFEHFDITSDTYLGIILAPLDVDGLVDKQLGRAVWDTAIQDEFKAWYYNRAIYWEKLHLALKSFMGSTEQINQLITFVSDSENFLPETIWDNLMDTGKVRELLVDVENQEVSLPRILPWINKRITPRWRLLILEQMERSADAIQDKQYNLDKYNRWIDLLTADNARYGLTRLPDLNAAPPKKIRRQITKGVTILEKMIGKAKMSAFLSNEVITIEGHRYNYKIQKKDYNIYSRHVPNLTITCKDGTPLANACVYFNDTPFFDQIIALCLHVRDYAGELELLETANLSKYSAAAYNDTELVTLKKLHIDHPNMYTRIELQIEQASIDLINATRDKLDARIKPVICDYLYETIPLKRDLLEIMFTAR